MLTTASIKHDELSLPTNYLESLRVLVSVEEARQKAIAENDNLKTQLEESMEWYSIKRVAIANRVTWKTFNWRALKDQSHRQGYPIHKVFDANYGEVNVYHISVWKMLYPKFVYD